MEKLNQDVLSVMPENWLSNSDRISHRFSNIQGYVQKNRGRIEIHIIGGRFSEKTGCLALAGVEHDLTCHYANCSARIRIYGELQSIIIKERTIYEFKRDVELIKTHDCVYGQLQRQTLAYMDIIRMHLMKNRNYRLNSYTGLYVYQRGQGSKSMVNAPFGILDHLFEPDRPTSATVYGFCNNNRNMVCCLKPHASRQKNTRETCNTRVFVRQRDTYTCKVASIHAEQSDKV